MQNQIPPEHAFFFQHMKGPTDHNDYGHAEDNKRRNKKKNNRNKKEIEFKL